MKIIMFPRAAARAAAVCRPSLSDAAAAFLSDLRLAGRSDRTLGGHRQELARLDRWLDGERLDWHALSDKDLRRYCRLRAHLGHSARSNMYCSLRLFYSWCVDEGYIVLSPASGLKTPPRPRPLPKALTQDQVRQLVAYLAAQTSVAARRDEALLLTALYAGLRAKELATLRWSQVDLAGRMILIPLSKMAKGRAVPIHPDLYGVLMRWKQIQGLDGSGPVFASLEKPGQPIAVGRVGKIAKRAAKATGLPLTAHVLRHTFATWLLRKSKNLYAVSKALGHSQVRQTEIYVSADVEDLRQAVVELPGLGGW